MIRGGVRALDDRLASASWVRQTLHKAFPNHWSFLLGEVALYSFVVLVVTGIFLSFFFEPSLAKTTYRGSYAPLDGVEVSRAYASVLDLSFDVRVGLVMRQTHHWAALIFVGSLAVHLGRVFFTGAFRRPRELNWAVGLTLLLLVMANGFFGYTLLDDLLSGTGLAIAYAIGESVPVVGSWLTFLFFGGEFPAESSVRRMFVMHVLVLPAAIAGLIAVHMAILWRQKHTQFPGEGRSETNVVGARLWPTYAAKSIAFLLLVSGVTVLLGGLVQINPVWLWGPFDPAAVTTAAQPDFYVGWLDGALRLFPAWEIRAFGHTVSPLFWPGVVMPLALFGVLYAWPFLERRATGDRDEHHLLDRPRDRPVRTALGIAGYAYIVVLIVAGGADVLAVQAGWSVQATFWVLRVCVFVVPPALGLLAWRWCRDLTAAERDESEDEPAEEPDEGADDDGEGAEARAPATSGTGRS